MTPAAGNGVKLSIERGLPRPRHLPNAALLAAHRGLIAETLALRVEHEALGRTPGADTSRHAAHRDRLRQQVFALRAHLADLKAARRTH